jgi:hypothetical protein
MSPRRSETNLNLIKDCIPEDIEDLDEHERASAKFTETEEPEGEIGPLTRFHNCTHEEHFLTRARRRLRKTFSRSTFDDDDDNDDKQEGDASSRTPTTRHLHIETTKKRHGKLKLQRLHTIRLPTKYEANVKLGRTVIYQDDFDGTGVHCVLEVTK